MQVRSHAGSTTGKIPQLHVDQTACLTPTSGSVSSIPAERSVLAACTVDCSCACLLLLFRHCINYSVSTQFCGSLPPRKTTRPMHTTVDVPHANKPYFASVVFNHHCIDMNSSLPTRPPSHAHQPACKPTVHCLCVFCTLPC